MNILIEKLLKKRGINDLNDLTDEEKAIYDEWEKVLSLSSLTLKDLEKFLNEQVPRLTKELIEPDISDKKNIYLKARIADFMAILAVIQKPKIAKKELENYIKSLIK